jgi:hypothetical protein
MLLMRSLSAFPFRLSSAFSEAYVACCADLAELLHHGGAEGRLPTCRSRGYLS